MRLCHILFRCVPLRKRIVLGYKWDLTGSGFEKLTDLDQWQFFNTLFSRRHNDVKHSKAFPIRCVSLVFHFVMMVFAAAVSLAFPMRCRRRFVCDAGGGVPPSCALTGTGVGVPVSPRVLPNSEKQGKIKEDITCLPGLSLGVGGLIFPISCLFTSFPVVVIPSLFDFSGGWSSCALRC